MAVVSSARSRAATVFSAAALAWLAVFFVGTSPVVGQTAALSVGVDVAVFSQRAESWRQANIVHRQQALVRAEALGEQAQEAERIRAERAAAAAAAAVTVPSSTAVSSTAVSSTAVSSTAVSSTAVSSTAVSSTAVSSTAVSAPVSTVGDSPHGERPTAEQWAALRHCESSGQYDRLNPNGRYRGAYQFSRATWDWIASKVNQALLGGDPAAASPADQDAMAVALYDQEGAKPWPQCGRHLL